ncbi:venom serine protease inhibitor-like [Cylas formicarius]|uniref:venom serine protease inhibitor-like n=1 Tax=Cylas formicarius TaxID=197179 RepID=UPI002958D598|nr:venom serine protease inhibitor-like [Cylas formicarius]
MKPTYFWLLCALTVLVASSKLRCEKDEVVSECASPCPDTCAPNFNSGIACPKKRCVVGCVCKSGYVRDDTGICVLSSLCPPPPSQQCDGPNQAFTTCGTACPETCHGPKTNYCVLICKIGCACKPGYVLNEKTGQCVHRSEC